MGKAYSLGNWDEAKEEGLDRKQLSSVDAGQRPCARATTTVGFETFADEGHFVGGKFAKLHDR